MSNASIAEHINAIIFDIGGVLIDWNQRHLYRKIIPNEADMERFLGDVCTPAWHQQHDRGRPMAETIPELTRQFPDRASLIEARSHRHGEMFGGCLEEVVHLLERLHGGRARLFGLSNWPAETFPDARKRFPFLALLNWIIVSGQEGVCKPDRQIFDILVKRCAVDPPRSLFIDDHAPNVAAAERLGFHVHHFREVSALQSDLWRRGLIA